MLILSAAPVSAQDVSGDSRFDQFLRVVSLRDYNTQVVLLGTALLGMCGGLVGVFMLLRKRSLIGDVIGHSALPGIAIAYIITQLAQPGSAKNVPMLVLGAFLAGLLGALCVMLIDRFSRLKSDAALAIVLSIFYGLGTALLTVIQQLPTASSAGLKTYLNGQTAALTASDVGIFAVFAFVLCLVTLLLFKELALLCFDDDFAAATGWPVFWLDALLLGLVVGVTIVGMQTVGLVLVVAILIIPASAARFWTDELHWLTAISALIGALAAVVGTIASAMYPKIAAGAVIVLSGSVMFLISMLIGKKRGLIWRGLEHRRVQRRIGRHDLLRSVYELIEADSQEEISENRLLQMQFRFDDLLNSRSWSRSRLHGLIQQALRDETLEFHPSGTYSLTPEGAALARRAVRNHRLWEIYLITYADVAPSHVDTDADRIEHILGPEMIRELEARLEGDETKMPSSPHSLS